MSPAIFRQHWREVRRGRPGSRFQERFRRAEQKRRQGEPSGRLFNIGAAIVLFAIGIVFAFIPGPAIAFFFIAAALLATESRALARFMDRGEVKIRALVSVGRKRWAGASVFARVALVTLIAVVVAAFVFATWFAYRGLAG